jgi:DNA polymerase-1
MKRLLIIDGSNLLFQMFYGMPSRIVNGEGKAIQGTLGFVGAMLKIIRRVRPSHVAVLFDGECENGRRELDEAYKANRPDYSDMPGEDTPFSQLPDLYAALDYLGIAHKETTDCEADDWIAGYALTLGQEMEIVIASQDSDFFQLITDTVSVLRYRGEKTVLCDPDYIRNKLGIEPGQYADFKALTGDTADNIQGVPSIGKKRAAEIVKNCADIEALKASALTFLPCKAKECVLSSFAILERNLALITLHAKEIEGYDAHFDEEKIGFRNSQILSACHVFD